MPHIARQTARYLLALALVPLVGCAGLLGKPAPVRPYLYQQGTSPNCPRGASTYATNDWTGTAYIFETRTIGTNWSQSFVLELPRGASLKLPYRSTRNASYGAYADREAKGERLGYSGARGAENLRVRFEAICD